MKKIILCGATGLLGQDIHAYLTQNDIPIIPFSSKTLDITSKKSVATLAQHKDAPIIINCAAYTQVDQSETHFEEALALNGVGPHHLAQLCKAENKTLIHFSTDYIFNGSKKTPYTETDIPAPINAYGQSKLAGELAITSQLEKYYIFRIQWLYGQHGPNFLNTILKRSKEKESLSIINDQIGTPTWTHTIAKTIHDILSTPPPYGTYHLTPTGYTNWADFATEALTHQGITTPIKHIPSTDYPLPAKRPKNGQLNTNKLTQEGLSLPHWKSELHTYLEKCSQD